MYLIKTRLHFNKFQYIREGIYVIVKHPEPGPCQDSLFLNFLFIETKGVSKLDYSDHWLQKDLCKVTVFKACSIFPDTSLLAMKHLFREMSVELMLIGFTALLGLQQSSNPVLYIQFGNGLKLQHGIQCEKITLYKI